MKKLNSKIYTEQRFWRGGNSLDNYIKGFENFDKSEVMRKQANSFVQSEHEILIVPLEKPLCSEQSPAMLTQSQVRSSHTLLRKSGFSPLEKPLRSEQSPAMLTQSQVRSSHTLLCKSGFSLLENAFCSHLLPALHRSRMARCSHTDYRNCVAQSSAFSPLEKPLRSEQSPAMLTQSQVRSSHTLLCKSGFSLAETMVVLVIVAILMAAAAPLIAKKMSNDLKKPISVDSSGKNLYVAIGENQILSVGSNKPNLKLKVNGNAEMNGDLKIFNKPTKDAAEINMIFTSDGIKTKSGTPETEEYLFKVDPDTRETNIEIAIPDYNKIHAGKNGNSKYIAPSNGFIYSTNSLRGLDIFPPNQCTGAASTNEATTKPDSLNMKLRQMAGNDRPHVGSLLAFPLMVPISKGSCYKCLNTVLTDVGDYNGTSGVEGTNDNRCYFIPLKNAKTITVN